MRRHHAFCLIALLSGCTFAVPGIEVDGATSSIDAMAADLRPSDLAPSDQGRGPLPDLANPVDLRSAGTLTGSSAPSSATVGLAGISVIDWTHWGLNPSPLLDQKAGGNQISDISSFLGTSPQTFMNAKAPQFSWVFGNPDTVNTGTKTGIYIEGASEGFQFTVAASTTLRTLRIFVGGERSQGELQARLSDGSAPDYLDSSNQKTNDVYFVTYTLSYSAASSGQTLEVSWRNLTSFGDPQHPTRIGIEAVQLN